MPILRYLHVTKQFAPNAYGVLDINLEVEPGELVVITGHTGSGKTTLMKLLTREYSVSEGELYFHETPVHALKSNKIHLHRRQIGVVYQDYRLIKDLTVWENVALPLYIAGKKDDEIEQRVSDLLNLIKLTDKYELFPNQLSGGEAQRVSIARSLALAPELIFADEPTGNLDSDTSKTIALLLAKINELGTTILLSTHDLTLLDVFTNERHVQLEKGAIIHDSGTQQSVKSESTPTSAESEPAVATSMGIPINIEATESQEKNSEKAETADSPLITTPPVVANKPFWHRLPLVGKKHQKKSTTETEVKQNVKQDVKQDVKHENKSDDSPTSSEKATSHSHDSTNHHHAKTQHAVKHEHTKD